MKPGKRVFENLAAASHALDIHVSVLRIAKAKGCPAFAQGSRIREEYLVPWIAEHSEELKRSVEANEDLPLKGKKTLEEIRKLKIYNDVKEGKLIPRAEVIREHVRFEKAVRELMNQKLCNEFPAMVSGLPVDGVRVYSRNLLDAIVAEMKKLVGAFEI